MTVSCSLTKFGEAFTLITKEAKAAAEVLLEEIIRRHGPPKTIYSDGGRECVNETWSHLMKLLMIRKITTCPYTPQANGQVERFNGILETMIRTWLNSQTDDVEWDDFVSVGVHAYNTTVNTTTGYTPHYLMYGVECPMPMDTLIRDAPIQDLDEWVSKKREMLLTALL